MSKLIWNLGSFCNLIILQLFFLIHLQVHALKVLEYFVQSNTCPDSNTCTGSKEFPFPDLFEALKVISTTGQINREVQESLVLIKLMDENLNGISNYDSFGDFFIKMNKILFESWTAMNIELSSAAMSGHSYVDISGDFFHLEVVGTFTVKDISFRASFLENYSLNKEYALYDSKLHIFKAKVNGTRILFKNTEFEGLYVFTNSGGDVFLYFSLINADADRQITIELWNCNFFNNYFPQGIIYAMEWTDSSPPLRNLTINYLFVNNYNPLKNFLLWKEPKNKQNNFFKTDPGKRYDFILILSGFQILVNKLVFTWSSRFLLAFQRNNITMNSCEFTAADTMEAPEIIFLEMRNQMNVQECKFYEFTKISHMDPGGSQDFAFTDENDIPSNLMNYIKIQSVFFFGEENDVNFSRNSFSDLQLFKRKNYLYSLFNAESYNSFVFNLNIMNNIYSNVEEKGGIFSIFSIRYKNRFVFSNNIIKELVASTNSIWILLFTNQMNSVFYTNTTLINVILKTKANYMEVNKFWIEFNDNFIENLKITPSSKYLIAAINSFFVKNTVVIDLLKTINISCFFACLGVIGVYNTVSLKRADASYVLSDFLSADFFLGLLNILKLSDSLFSYTKAVSGLIMIYFSNTLEIIHVSFEKNTAIFWSGFGKIYSESEGACIYAKIRNTILIYDSQFFESKSFIQGGVMLVGELNEIKIERTLLESNRAVDSASQGGVIALATSNKLLINSCAFYNNSGSYGGVIFLNLPGNLLEIKDSNFIFNRGTFGGVIYIASSFSQVTLIDCTFEMNKGLEKAGIFFFDMDFRVINDPGYLKQVESLIQYIKPILHMTRCTFYNNLIDSDGEFIIHIGSDIEIVLRDFVLKAKNAKGAFLGIKNSCQVTILNGIILNFQEKNPYLGVIKGQAKNNLVIGNISIQYILNPFLNLTESNICHISYLTISDNGDILPQDCSLIILNLYNFLQIEHLNLLEIDAYYTLLITSYLGNEFAVKSSLFYSIWISSISGLIRMYKKGVVTLESCRFNHFFVWNLPESIILHIVGTSNKAYFLNCEFSGEFYSSFSDPNPFLIVFTSNGNDLLLKNNKFFIKILNQLKLGILLLSNNSNNFVTMEDLKIRVDYLQNFIMSLGPNFIKLRLIKLWDNLLLNDFIRVTNKTHLSIEDSVFKNVSLPEIFFLFNINYISTFISNKIKLIAIRKAFTNFIVVDSALIYLTNTNINYCKLIQQPTSTKYYLIKAFNSTLNILRTELICVASLLLGRASIFATSSNVSIKKSFFAFNRWSKGLGSVIFLEKGSSLNVSYSKFAANSAYHGGVLAAIDFQEIRIEKSDFLFNDAQSSREKLEVTIGAEYGLETVFPLDSRFIGRGGCFFFMSLNDSYTSQNFLAWENVFKDNFAEAGGILFTRNIFIDLDSFSFWNKIAKNHVKSNLYGSLFASPAYRLGLQEGGDFDGPISDSIILSEILPPNYQSSKCLFRFISFDIYNQITLGDDLFVDSSNMQTLKLSKGDYQLSIDSSDGTLCFPKIEINDYETLLKLSKTVWQVIKLTFSDLKPLLNFTEYTFSQVLAENYVSGHTGFNVSFRMRSCISGEYFSTETLECLPCKPLFFSFRKNFLTQSSCVICENQPFFCYGGANLTTKNSFWRYNENSNNFLKCPNSKACLGDPEGGPQISVGLLNVFDPAWAKGKCAVGYRGALCSRCEVHRGKNEWNSCQPCNDLSYLVLLIAGHIFKLALFTYTILEAFLLCKKLKGGKVEKDLVYSNYYLKIFIMHFQFLYTIIAFPLQFPEFLYDAFKLLIYPFSNSGNKSMSLECILPNTDPALLTYSKVVITLLTPFFTVIVMKLGLYLIKQVKICKRERTKSFFKKNKLNNSLPQNPRRRVTLFSEFLIKNLDFGSLILIVMMISFIDIIRTFLEMFSYLNIATDAEPEYRLLVDFEVEYYSKMHANWRNFFFLPVIVLVGLIIPVYILFKIYSAKRNNQLYKPEILSNFGYFYYAFKKEACLYEFMYFARKIFMIMLEIFIIKLLPFSQPYNGPLAASLLCMVLGYFTALSVRMKPFDSEKYSLLNRLDQRSLRVQTITSFLILSWIVLHPNYDALGDSTFISILSYSYLVLGFSINLLFLVQWLIGIWKLGARQTAITFIRDFRELFSKVKTKLSKLSIQSMLPRNTLNTFGSVLSHQPEIDSIFSKKEIHRLPSLKPKSQAVVRFQVHDIVLERKESAEREAEEPRSEEVRSGLEINYKALSEELLLKIDELNQEINILKDQIKEKERMQIFITQLQNENNHLRRISGSNSSSKSGIHPRPSINNKSNLNTCTKQETELTDQEESKASNTNVSSSSVLKIKKGSPNRENRGEHEQKRNNSENEEDGFTLKSFKTEFFGSSFVDHVFRISFILTNSAKSVDKQLFKLELIENSEYIAEVNSEAGKIIDHVQAEEEIALNIDLRLISLEKLNEDLKIKLFIEWRENAETVKREIHTLRLYLADISQYLDRLK